MKGAFAVKFSVIIPTLNEAGNIGNLLAALQAQEYSGDWEIIVSDGDSDDDTPDIVDSFAGVLLLRGACGVSRQRNVGAQSASGELLVFMDADDFPAPDFLQRIAQSYRRFPFAVACPWFVAQDSGFLVRVLYLGFNILFFMGQGWLKTGSGVCLIVQKTVFETIGGFDESLHLGEDVQLIRRAARYGWHRHLCIALKTSGRRFSRKGAWKLMLFYARISPYVLLGQWAELQKFEYQAAPYKEE